MDRYELFRRSRFKKSDMRKVCFCSSFCSVLYSLQMLKGYVCKLCVLITAKVLIEFLFGSISSDLNANYIRNLELITYLAYCFPLSSSWFFCKVWREKLRMFFFCLLFSLLDFMISLLCVCIFFYVLWLQFLLGITGMRNISEPMIVAVSATTKMFVGEIVETGKHFILPWL